MRLRLRRKRNPGGTPLTATERHRRSQVVTMDRIVRTMRESSLACAPTPSPRTIERWVADDTDFAARYVAALSAQTEALAANLIATVDRDALNPQGRRRATALRGRIAARRQWLALRAKRTKGETATSRGISEEGIAILQRSADALGTSAGSDLWKSASPHAHDASEAEAGDADESRTDGALPDDAAYAEDERYPCAPDGRVAPRPFLKDAAPDGQAAPHPFLNEGRGNDEEGKVPSEDETDEDGEPRFHRLPLTVAEEEALKARRAGLKPPPDDEKKSPWKPDTPMYVRFDTGGVDVSNRREEGTTWSDFDPLAW